MPQTFSNFTRENLEIISKGISTLCDHHPHSSKLERLKSHGTKRSSLDFLLITELNEGLEHTLRARLQ